MRQVLRDSCRFDRGVDMIHRVWPFRAGWQHGEDVRDLFDAERAAERFEPPGSELRRIYAEETLLAVREDEIHLLSGAERILAEAVERLVEAAGHPAVLDDTFRAVARGLYRHMYHAVTSGALILAISMPQGGRRAFVEIPAHLWGMKAGGRYIN